MRHICERCGQEFEERDMEFYSPIPGRPQWFCWDCWKKSQYEVTKSEIHRRTKLARINEEKRRHK